MISITRILLSFMLIYWAYEETGPYTTGIFVLILCVIELMIVELNRIRRWIMGINDTVRNVKNVAAGRNKL